MKTTTLSLVGSLLTLDLAAQTEAKVPPRDPETGKPIVYVLPNQPVPADVLVEEMPVYKIHPDLDPNLTEEEKQKRELEKKIEYYRAQGLDYQTGLPLKQEGDTREAITKEVYARDNENILKSNQKK
ncbi:MAG: hypothetical protein N2110_07395 [Flavobacteriales bacterium]|nr:hypothetical protein [Flavobacteriales bacterium]MCX7768828.1 hypothetical protein [Flavobacteriales bacterium]MDW8410820.1 hypothetical protein [Flavobacteriales bacterium]